MDRETYKRLILAMWQYIAAMETLELVRLEIASKRLGTREEYHAVRALRRAYEDLHRTRKSPKG